MNQKKEDFLNSIRYDTSPKNNNKRKVKNSTTPHKVKANRENSEKLKDLRRKFAIIAVTLAAAGIGTYAMHKTIEKRDDYNSINIQTEIENNGIETRPELYKVLSNTDLDEKLNSYYAEPNKENKNELLKNINPQELAVYNFEMLKASIADGLGIKKEDITIRPEGNDLRLYTPEQNLTFWGAKGKHNDSQIPFEYGNLISRITKQYQAYIDGEELNTEKNIADNLELKKYITEHTFSLRDGTLVLIDEDGKISEPSDGILRPIKFKEVEEDSER